MSQKRRNFTPQQKAEIVRRHLKDRVPVSTLAEELSIQPTQIYQSVAMVLEQAERLVDRAERSEKSSKRAEAKLGELKEQRIQRLEAKLLQKNEVVAELLEEHVQL